MPANHIRINLLGSQDLEHTPWGRLLSWATTYGRYIMITTEIVVLLAFISRFSLDRKNTDLTEELTQKQAIILANSDFEHNVKSLQADLATANTLLKDQSQAVDLITLIESLIPVDVYLRSLDVTKHTLAVSATAGTTGGFGQFLSNLQQTKQIRNVLLGEIRKEPISGIEFQLTADVGSEQKK